MELSDLRAKPLDYLIATPFSQVMPDLSSTLHPKKAAHEYQYR